MSSFKEFLSEQPHFVVNFGITCPEGHDLNGSDVRYMFDYGFEFLKDKTVSSKIENRFYNKKGKIPAFCRRHNLFFIWDFDTKTFSSPSTIEEKKMIEVARLGIETNATIKKDKRVKTEINRSKIYKG